MNTQSSFTILDGGGVCSPRGFRAGAVAAAIKYEGRDDLALLVSETPCTAAGVFTRNAVKSAAVQVSYSHLASGTAQAIIANSGCANACTGERGIHDAETMCQLAAESLGLDATEILVASTGVVGTFLPIARIKGAVGAVDLSTTGGGRFASAIMTTDTVRKEIAVSVPGSIGPFTIGAAAKGSGMIHPNMGTLLVFITTDASVERMFLQDCLMRVVDRTFNMVSIDGDTSPSDTVAILANGASGLPPFSADNVAAFEAALGHVCESLAIAIASDGEGAGKLIEIRVIGAESVDDARVAARTISTSPLVKTAVHGADPNWGRVACAVGRSDAHVDPGRMGILLNGIEVMRQGMPVCFDEDGLRKSLEGDSIAILVDLGLGTAEATAWGCDLSKDYVTINASYTT
jgi:glutamate N-acetyltransferase/amino-acid N-acetyltransferase